MPPFIEILSDDLEQTFKFPKVSANRAYWIWERFWDNHQKYDVCIKSMASQESGVPAMPYDLQQEYYNLQQNDIVKDLYHNNKVSGIAFSGNHDGNVLFIKQEALGLVKPMQYCIMD
jgi:WD40 repeat protein